MESGQPRPSSASSTISPELPLLWASPTPRPRQSLIVAFLGRATGRRGPSALVRESAASQLQERRTDWGYSRPVVALDMVLNLAFAMASVVMLCCSWRERPNVPVRAWIGVYGVQCVLHVVLVWMEYRRRNAGGRGGVGGSGDVVGFGGNESEEEVGRSSFLSNFSKRCESFNTMSSFVWWVIGFYWVVYGGETLLLKAPKLYWLAVVFLAFDVFAAIFCVSLACMIGMALCCCLPCIVAILYAIGQEGASDADINILPRYRYEESSGKDQKTTSGGGTMVPLGNSDGGMITSERVLPQEDADCCICLTSYEDGSELLALPCYHHFHSACIIKWLRINATCPLCKYNILSGGEQV